MQNQVTLENLHKIAKKIREYFKIGNLILINGPMGVGKTTLLKYVLNEYDVSSPSFLRALYYGNNYIHIDAYNLTFEKLLDLSIEDYLDSKCIIVEWGELYLDFFSQFKVNIINIDLAYEKDNRIVKIY